MGTQKQDADVKLGVLGQYKVKTQKVNRCGFCKHFGGGHISGEINCKGEWTHHSKGDGCTDFENDEDFIADEIATQKAECYAEDAQLRAAEAPDFYDDPRGA